ncbi:MAG: hypothetical protein LBB67_03610 [Oscillospiraceae bacterium]|jgi:hypothetical protein|nr:hypothetical protein [Oscillospiraceae bacterium]
MKKFWHSLAAVLLCLVMVLGVAPLSAVAVGDDITDKFTDPNFRAVVLKSYDKNKDGRIQVEEVENVLSLFCNNKSIFSLSGIEYFAALTSLYCYDNQLTTLDLSRNTELLRLVCDNNRLEYLDLSYNTKLEQLSVRNNELEMLDLSENRNLEKADVSYNFFESRDELFGSLGVDVIFEPQKSYADPVVKNYFKLWGITTKWEKTPLNWFLCVVCFGWIWMVF